MKTRNGMGRGAPRLIVCALACIAFAADQPLEYDVKAAFLLNFTRFIEWPPAAFADDQAPFAICVLGKDPFGRVIDDVVRGESVNGRALSIRRIAQQPPPQSCQVLFLEGGMKDAPKNIEGVGRGVLTVGEGSQ